MYDFVQKVKEIKGATTKIRIFYLLLDSLSIFLFFSVVALLLGLPVFYAFIPAVLSTAILLRKKTNVFRELARRYRYFEERLPAAYDNRGEDNLIIRDLGSEVSAKLDEVRYSSFLSYRKALIRVLIPVILSFVIVSMSFADIEPIELSINLQPVETPIIIGSVAGGEAQGLAPEGMEEEIFGRTSIAKIEGREVELELYPGGSEIRIRQVEGERRFEGVSEGEPELEPSEAFAEKIPEKYERVIKAYFEKLAAGG
jgi:hypothetical protein